MSWKAKIWPGYLLYENKLNLIFFQSLGLQRYKSVQLQKILFEFIGMLFISRSAQIHNHGHFDKIQTQKQVSIWQIMKLCF